MNIAIILVHNKDDAGNIAQIEALKSFLTEVVDGPFLNEETGETWTTIHHEIIGLGIPHAVKVYQVVPFGVTPPPNRDEINSGGMVQYRAGDEDKTGDHPRFFNWGLKRGTDYGADIVIYLEDPTKLDLIKLIPDLQKIQDPNDTTEFIDKLEYKISSLKLLLSVGKLNEYKTKEEGITELKQRVIQKGWKNG